MKNFIKLFILFIVGGTVYLSIELLWRGYSHYSMFIMGGLALITVGYINEYLSWRTPLWIQCGIGCIIITSLELISGIILNIIFKLNIWHYESYSFLGQISLFYSVGWYFLSLVGIVLDDFLRWGLFKEERPGYYIL